MLPQALMSGIKTVQHLILTDETEFDHPATTT